MRIAMLSGKGGTGKTTIATNLFHTYRQGILIDTDVEEPNSHLFLKPNIHHSTIVSRGYPIVDPTLCDLCGKCGDFCRFNAILPAKKKVLVYKELCHDCGGCGLVCPQDAIRYKQRSVGKIHEGMTDDGLTMYYGKLDVGEISGVPIIEKMHEVTREEPLVFIDSPPGSACTTVASVEVADYAVIVAEPTPFGVSDMKMVVEMLEEMQIEMGVVVNKAGLGDDELYTFCKEKKLEILAEIPFEKKYAKDCAEGKLITDLHPEYRTIMHEIIDKILNGKDGA